MYIWHQREHKAQMASIASSTALQKTRPVAEQALMRTSIEVEVEVEVTIIPRIKVVFEIDYLNYHLQDDM